MGGEEEEVEEKNSARSTDRAEQHVCAYACVPVCARARGDTDAVNEARVYDGRASFGVCVCVCARQGE